MAKVCVEDNLGNVKDVLQRNGFEVVSLQGNQIPACDCCVISGVDQNVMGMADRATEVNVINAEGLTAEEVLDEVRQRVRH